MDQVLAQIDLSGSLDASWVLNGITVLAGFLLWNQIKDIKHDIHEMTVSIKDLVKVVNSNEKRISILEKLKDIEDKNDD
ncbi:MAG TPA: hypothetical protein PKN99_03085 [Cyclobacteriaceae bacterium]|nr:hypothetical protein [Cyclobacteriaceae bacterium]